MSRAATRRSSRCKAGEFVTGYVDETGDLTPVPQPEALGRNGTYVVFRKLHQDVAGFRRYLRDHSASPEDEELLAAKIVGRWRSGAPLVLAPERDDPALGADPARNNDFLYRAEDERGLRCPVGSHIRRMNPRDAVVTGEVRLHRMIRRGTSYGPLLPDGVLEDDGADRGLCFVFVGAHLARQFEFVQAQWVNDGRAFSAPQERDPLIGATRRHRRLHDPDPADPPAPHRSPALRHHPRRRVLLRTVAHRPALAGRSRRLTGVHGETHRERGERDERADLRHDDQVGPRRHGTVSCPR